jgi:signal transduction histidine kinase
MRLDIAMGSLVAALGGVTAVLWMDQGLSSSVFAPELDVAINVGATLVAGAVAILGWVRWVEVREPAALFESAAFLALTTTNLLTIGALLNGRPEIFGLDVGTLPERQQIGASLWTLARLSAAIVLVVGAIRAMRREAPWLPPLVVAFLPAASMLVIGIAIPLVPQSVPSFQPGSKVIADLGGGTVDLAGLVVVFLQLVICALFFVAAFLYRRLYRRDRLLLHAFLATGLLVAAFSQVHFAVQPLVTSGTVTSSDVLRVLFYGILLFGIEAQAQADMAGLRLANSELERLREVEAASAVLEERSRLAREVHDGLAQDLWFAKLKQARITEDESVDETTRKTAQEVLRALDIALADARQAVMALRTNPAAGSTLEQLLADYVDDFGERYGVPAVFEAIDPLPPLPPRTEAEIVRVIQEALNNVRKHAEATSVRVRVEALDGQVRFSVIDNGRGFQPQGAGKGRFGINSMRERAGLTGGRLQIESSVSHGTEVVLEVPAGTRPVS